MHTVLVISLSRRALDAAGAIGLLLTACGSALLGVGYDREVGRLEWGGALTLAVAAFSVFLEVDDQVTRDSRLLRDVLKLAAVVSALEAGVDKRPDYPKKVKLARSSKAMKALQAGAVLAAGIAAAYLSVGLSRREQENSGHEQSTRLYVSGICFVVLSVLLFLYARRSAARVDNKNLVVERQLRATIVDLTVRLEGVVSRLEKTPPATLKSLADS